jgi:CHAT domain-containing protein
MPAKECTMTWRHQSLGVRLTLTLVLGLLTPGCQTTMSLEEAKTVTARFAKAPLVAPPRTINDITAILDQQERTEPGDALRAQADAAPPDTADASVLASFYHQRGLAARGIGRSRQERQDLARALQYARSGASPRHILLFDLGLSEFLAGSVSRQLEYSREAIAAVPGNNRGWLITLHTSIARVHAGLGDLKAAEAAYAEASAVFLESFRWQGQRPDGIAERRALMTKARAALAEARGQYRESEALYRQALEILTGDPAHRDRDIRDQAHWFLARSLVRQGRVIEAESEARLALRGTLARHGRYSARTGWKVRNLILVLMEQGRYRESERLARAAADIYEKIGAAPESLMLTSVRTLLATSLALQGRHHEALGEYEAIRAGLSRDPAMLDRFLGGHPGYAEVLLETGRLDRAFETLTVALARGRVLASEAHQGGAQIRATLARVHAVRGDVALALREFREAVPLLLAASPPITDDGTTSLAAEHRLVTSLSSYIDLLSAIRGTALEREAGIDAIAEAFRVAEAARGRLVQRALTASASRTATHDPALADLVRREQDAQRQLVALSGTLASILSQPGREPDAGVVTDLRARVDELRRATVAVRAQIEREFPGYGELIQPKSLTMDEARALLRPGEALIATLVARDCTFVWAVPQRGPVAFAVAPIGAGAIEHAVASLRTALAPDARTLGDIPEFDVALAHRLYQTLLEPVRSGWNDARSLLVVAHGPLGQLPLALLPTQPVSLPPASGAMFSNYRGVPWLVRSHAVTLLPSVAALATLRGGPGGAPGRRPFVGFGDPYFSREQAALATADVQPPSARVALATRSRPVTLRSSPPVLDSSRLGNLPRLPETADEILGIAAAMGADPVRDVFLGARANERAVKTLDLTPYRVLAFATHGLVPGDLDGLTQPALALSAPEVADVDGDGLLTMDEILRLRLDADWVVLSGCNTASGDGTGAEAVSGLGRAFFYAGARALLVSNWPVETTSARTLTTDLFRRQRALPGLSRAEALQQTLNWLIDEAVALDADRDRVVFSYAHPIFWAPFTLIGDGG